MTLNVKSVSTNQDKNCFKQCYSHESSCANHAGKKLHQMVLHTQRGREPYTLASFLVILLCLMLGPFGSHYYYWYLHDSITIQLKYIWKLCNTIKLVLDSWHIPFSFQFEQIDVVQTGEPFLLIPELNCTSPWPIQLQSSTVSLVTLTNVNCL